MPRKATVLDVREYQCSQAVMALLRQLVHTPPGGQVEVRWSEPDARRDMLAVIKRQGHTRLSEAEGEQFNTLLVAKKA